MNGYQSITAEIKDILVRELGREAVLEGAAVLADCGRDESEVRGVPELVVAVREVGQIARLLALANEYRFPVTPRGGGTGLAGGCLPRHGGVVLLLTAMNRIKAIDEVNLVAEVEPGVITKYLREAARAKGLFYPPDPAGMDRSTIGGNAATGAGGPACVKYGTTKDYVLGLEAVLPSGRVLHTGVKTRKGVVGYDLTHLLVGSEGTLAVITGLTLKLIPHPPAVAGMAAVFPDLTRAMQAVSTIMARGHLPSAIEFLDHQCLALVGDLLPFRIADPRASLLIVEADGAVEQVGTDIELIGDICREIGATNLIKAMSPEDRENIWDVRRQVSLRIHDHAVVYVPEDVAVPIGRIADLVGTLPTLEKKHGINIFAFGHAGDGNIHLCLTADDPRRAEQMEKGIREVLSLVVGMGGTISGEHGIGAAKMDYLPLELSADSVDLQIGLKRLFDPNLILNPGKLFSVSP
jgi:D-lactate dehydrogenase (cytochrome)